MDDREFAEIVKSTKGVILRAIETHLAARFYHAIDDVVQETYIRAYKALIKKKFRGDSSLETWLYVIAKNESLRMMKKLKREEDKFNNASLDLKIKGEEKWPVDDMKIMYTKSLERLIRELPEKYRCVMELVALGFSEKQIADQLALKRGTVKSRSSRGRELMQRILKGGVK